MSCLKELSLVLIVGCLAVYAAEKEPEKEPTDTARVAGDQDVRLLINPFNFLTKTTPKPERPTTIVVKPAYHPYPPHHHYDDDDDDYYYRPRPRPTYRPSRPHPPVYPQHPPVYAPHPPVYGQYPSLYPQHPPVYPQHPPLYAPHPPLYTARPPLYPYYPQSSYGYGYPWSSRPSSSRPPVIVVVRPSDEDKNDNPEVVTVPSGKERSRYFYSNPMYEYAEEEVMPEVVQAPEQPQYEYEGRNIKVDGVAINADSAEDDDTITVDTKDVKLPFGLHLSSLPRDGKKVRDQEALIYLRNYKNGRKLQTFETA